MLTITIGMLKGGCSKSTTAIHLAVAAKLAGMNAVIVDIDSQQSAAKWADRREEDLPAVVSAQAVRLHKELARIESLGAEICIIDTAPRSDSAALEAIKASSFVIIPTRCSVLDLEAVNATTELVKSAHKKSFVVLSAVPAKGSEAASARDYLTGLGIDVAPVQTGNRIAFARALLSGQAAQEWEPKGKAATEATHLFLHASTYAH